ncbi:MAG: putative protein YcbX [Anaerolineales bacterium]|nr:putative protein YcbX [Anaerolineales bacterium]
MIQLASLIYYPIKACRGFEVTAAQVTRMGLARDRRMMVVTPQGKFLTQREHPRFALVTPTLEDDSVILSAPNFDSLRVPIRSSGAPVAVDIWNSKNVDAIDQGDEAAQWFSDWLRLSVRLVHIADGFIRNVNENYAVRADDHTGFADGYPILLVSEESLADLNSRLDIPLPMNRFRPNLVVRGCDPFAEDTWKRIRIGGVTLALVKPCGRCLVTTIDKETLEKSKEPLKTLTTFRKRNGKVMFGQNGIPLGDARLEVGMNVDVLS